MPSEPSLTPSRVPKIVAITSGKGGVGKTSIAVNLSIALARSGQQVCLMDGDTGLANVNILMGLHPEFTLEHLISGEQPIDKVVVKGPEGVAVIPGASGVSRCVEMGDAEQERMVDGLRQVENQYDWLLLDTAAGISSLVLHFIAAAQVAVVVITPEPTSLTDAFSLLKVLRRRGYQRKVQVIVNMVPTSERAQRIFYKFQAAVKKYIGLETEYLGPVWMDESMRSAVIMQRPVALFSSNDPSSKSFYRLADRMVSMFDKRTTPRLAFSAYWQRLADRKQQKVMDAKLAAESVHEATPPVITHEDSLSPARNLDEQWLTSRRQVLALLQDERTTPDEILGFLSSCIVASGDRLGKVAVDLIHAMLQSVQKDDLTREQSDLLSLELSRLGLIKENSRARAEIQENANSMPSAPTISETVPRYDARGFGSQDALAAQIRDASGAIRLDRLLETIKMRSLTQASDEKAGVKNESTGTTG
ncbi:MAG: MinD/ParA family protein [Hahellaceae bacterium]|nr:MinD/ParA family protein [Hahellaceae bacterium]